MTAWSAKVWRSSICYLGERPNLSPPDADRPDGLGTAEQRNGERCPVAQRPRKRAALWILVRLGLDVGDLDRPPVEYRTSHGRSSKGKFARRKRGDRALVGHEAELVTVHLEDRGIGRVAQTGGAPQHCREHGLDIGRGAGDNAQDLGRRGPLLQRLCQGTGDLRIGRCWRASRIGAEGRAALPTELLAAGVLVLAAGTGHVQRLPSPDL